MLRRLLHLLRQDPSTRAERRWVDDIQFLCEQDGVAERELKARWREILAADGNITAAYLVRVSGDQRAEQTVVLAIRSRSGPDGALIGALGDQFRGCLSKDTFVDILFMSEPQERSVRAIANPFYAAP